MRATGTLAWKLRGPEHMMLLFITPFRSSGPRLPQPDAAVGPAPRWIFQMRLHPGHLLSVLQRKRRLSLHGEIDRVGTHADQRLSTL
jgi:hypothetical protein